MAPKQKAAAKVKAKPPEIEPGSIDELVRVLVLQIRYQGALQGALVHDLSALGLAPSRIAELLDTSANTVSQQKRKKRPEWPTKKMLAER
jgi:hypothetical protein